MGVGHHFRVDIEPLSEWYAAQISGVRSYWDRVRVFATLPKICYAGGMTSYPYERQVRIFNHSFFGYERACLAATFSFPATCS